jgi:hypothetical protein
MDNARGRKRRSGSFHRFIETVKRSRTGFRFARKRLSAQSERTGLTASRNRSGVLTRRLRNYPSRKRLVFCFYRAPVFRACWSISGVIRRIATRRFASSGPLV